MADKIRWLEAELPRPRELDPRTTARTLRVAPELAGTRLDVFLKLMLRHTSRTQAKKIARFGAYSPEGSKLRPNQRLRAEQHVVLWRVPVDELDPDLELPAVYEDDDLLVINKPPGLTVHPTASHYHRTVTRILEAQRPELQVSLVHRLDQDTSGILLIAKHTAADRAFKMLLEGTLRLPADCATPLRKTYRAITWGRPPEGLCQLPLERDVDNPLRVKMQVAKPNTGLEALTQITVVAQRGRYCLVECGLLTGRQHQIRVHLAALGTPVVGDRLYGPDERLHARGADGELTDADRALLELPRQALHAHRYELPHALTFAPLDLRAPLASDMVDFWESKAELADCDDVPNP